MKDSDVKTSSPLQRAQAVGEGAAALGFDWEFPAEALEKVREEVDELSAELQHRERATEELGDLLFAVVNVARKLDIDAHDALLAATTKFEKRFAAVLRWADEQGGAPTLSLDELEALWQRAKSEEAQS